MYKSTIRNMATAGIFVVVSNKFSPFHEEREREKSNAIPVTGLDGT
jgi:hypothetical protein